MNKRILVIDDDKSVRESFALALRGEDYSVDAVESGERGVAEILKNNYDLVFLDLKMPGMNGIETLKKIREADKSVPVYIVTAFHEEYFGQLKTAAEEGLNFELVKKPMNMYQIITVVKSILEQPVEM